MARPTPPITAAVVAVALILLSPTSRALAQQPAPRLLAPETLDRSIELGRAFLLNCQRPDGSFVYETDAVKGTDLGTRNAVREMGGLWALSVLQRHNPSPDSEAAIARSLSYQDDYAKHTAAGGRYLSEPGAREWTTNCVALYALVLLDHLANDELDAPTRAKHQQHLADTIKFLLSLRQTGGRFFSTYSTRDGRGIEPPHAYADGETLLALTRYAKEHAPNDAALRDTVMESAAVMYATYVRSALRADPLSEDTGGFYQWGSMAFYELYTTGWPGTQPYAARTIAMARWAIDVRGVLKLPGNTGHTYEGLAVAWELARLTNDAKNQRHIGDTIDKGLAKLLTWQIGSPMAGDAVPKTFGRTPKSRGGIVSSPNDPRIRIDTVQHQIHATMLARWLLFRPQEAADGR